MLALARTMKTGDLVPHTLGFCPQAADSPSPAERPGGRRPGPSAGSRACAACSCRTCGRPAYGARPGASRASRGRPRSSPCAAGAVPPRRTTPGRLARTVRPVGMPTRHRVLVPEHEQLGIFRPVTAEHQDGQAEYLARQQVDDLQQHPESQPPLHPSSRQTVQVTYPIEYSSGTGLLWRPPGFRSRQTCGSPWTHQVLVLRRHRSCDRRASAHPRLFRKAPRPPC